MVHKLKLIKTNLPNHLFNPPLFFKDKRESLYFNFFHYYYYIADWKIISASSCGVLFQQIIIMSFVFKRTKKNIFLIWSVRNLYLFSRRNLWFSKLFSLLLKILKICFAFFYLLPKFRVPT